MLNRPNDLRPESNSSSSNPSSQSATPILRNPEAPPRQLRPTPPATPRRVVDIPAAQPAMRRGAAPSETSVRYNANDGRRLTVGRDITLAGQISKCDFLFVEGTVEGMRYDGQSLEVADGGSFNGSVEVEVAEIAGVFDGVMSVRNRLTIRPTGRVTGTIRYGELEITAGGQINGELQTIQVQTPIRKPIVERSILDDEPESSEASSSRESFG
jgi:cytoskeletal protein CcmA (bactofilin family)